MIKIYGRFFETFTAIGTFINRQCPGKIAAAFERTMVNAHHCSPLLNRASALSRLHGLPIDDLKMRDFRVPNKCNHAGAWLMLSLREEISDLDQADELIRVLVSLC